MSKSKHIPGPWKVQVPDLNIQAEDHSIALVLYSDCEREANAHLIAAAPQLLKACKQAFGLCDEFLWAPYNSRPPSEERCRVLRAALGAAITAAEGETP